MSGPIGEPKVETQEKRAAPVAISLPISSLSPKPIPAETATAKAPFAPEDLDEDSFWKVSADDFPSEGTREEKSRFLLRYAILAPSNRNTQPWL